MTSPAPYESYAWVECEIPDWWMQDQECDPRPSLYYEAYGAYTLQILYFDQEWQGFISGLQYGPYESLAEAKRELVRIDYEALVELGRRCMREDAIAARRAALPSFDQGAML